MTLGALSSQNVDFSLISKEIPEEMSLGALSRPSSYSVCIRLGCTNEKHLFLLCFKGGAKPPVGVQTWIALTLYPFAGTAQKPLFFVMF